MILLLMILLLLMSISSKISPDYEPVEEPELSEEQELILELAGRELTLEEKVGQLFIIQPEALDLGDAGKETVTATMKATIQQSQPGGFIFMEGNIASPDQVTRFTENLTKACSIPPILCIDEEGGRVARLANAKGFNLTRYHSMAAIGETGKPENAQEAGWTIGSYIKEYGFNMDLAPVADVNTNSANRVIGNRSFGSSPFMVSDMVRAFTKGLHAADVLSCMKHFPGHGGTSADTHSGYVELTKSWDDLLTAELVPFVDNLDTADSVMVSHITMVNISKDGLPATLSRELVTGKLRDELEYDGVIMTDALNMGAVTKSWSSGEAAVMAVEAGNDMILMPEDYGEAYQAVLQAVQSGRISEEQLDESVVRILSMKEKIK